MIGIFCSVAQVHYCSIIAFYSLRNLRMKIEEEAKLKDGQKLVNHRFRQAGHLFCIDVDDYDIADKDGTIIGSVTIKLHTDTKAPFIESRDFQVYWNK